MSVDYLQHPQLGVETMSHQEAWDLLMVKDRELMENFSANLLNHMENRSFKHGFNEIIRLQHLQNKPAVCIAASPHLDDNLHLLKDYQDKVIIYAVDVVLERVLEAGIKPDFVTNLDISGKASQCWENVDTSDIALVTTTVCAPITVERWKGPIYFFNPTADTGLPKGELLERITEPTKEFGCLQSFHFVGFTNIQIAYTLKASQIMLIGYGFAFKDDKAYAGEIATQVVDEGVDYWEEKSVIEGRIEVEGQQTLRNLLLYRECTQTMLKQAKANLVFNCTEGGLLDYNNLPFLNCLERFTGQKISKTLKRQQRRRSKRSH